MMSTLLADFFETDIPIEQRLRLRHGIDVHKIRMHVFKYGELLTGDLVIELLDGATVLKTTTYTYTELNTLIGIEYSHGFLSVIEDVRLGGRKSNESSHEYIVRATFSGGHELLAWVMEYENPVIDLYGANQDNDAFKPKDLEIYTWH